ncbi:MAG: beta-hydroxyacyl-ACP dehydratase [Planctomycetota bacterium]|nr:beta-hydroxyacyl-ACP dehydratase [Planctomycetota bacterium]
MSSEQLFDFSSIDLNSVFMTPDQVADCNPQRGGMRQLDHVIYIDDGASKALGIKQVRDDEFWVDGHIPGRPLFPAVLMIEAAAQLSSILYQSRTKETAFLGFTRCDKAVFRGQVVPGDTLLLLAKEHKFQRRRFSCDAQGVVNDKVVFQVKITGMQL